MTERKKKLNQIVGVRKGTIARVQEEQTKIYRTVQQPTLFEGHTRKYEPLDAEGESFPDENKKVQFNMEERLKAMGDLSTEVFDIEFSCDVSNATARADLIVEGHTLAKDVPATTLLYLEKKLSEYRNTIMVAPELPTDKDWSYDIQADLYKTPPERAHRTNKVTEGVVLVPPTEKHPAQVDKVTKDIIVGHWVKTHHHGGLPALRKADLLRRCNKLLDAVQVSRELANMTEATEVKMGEALFTYLLAPSK